MADYTSDSQSLSPNTHRSKVHQHSPSAAQGQHKRKNRRRRHDPQTDGTVSDGAVFHSASGSPYPKPTHKQNHSVGISTGTPHHPGYGAGKAQGQVSRPASMAGLGLSPGTPAKEQAYAGASFQDSPAASTLPMPKFFSRSLSSSMARPASLPSKPAAENPLFESNSSPESNGALMPAPPRESQQSPLDIFFKADRAERDRKGSGVLNASLEGAKASDAAAGPNKSPHQSGQSVFLQEPCEHGINTSNPGRPSADPQQSSPAIQSLSSSEDARQAHTQSLKDMLFKTATNSSITPPRSASHGAFQTPEGVSGSPSPGPHSAWNPHTPQPSSEQRPYYSLHYGNRNLSPLFQAARADTPGKPSGLRQEMTSTYTYNGIFNRLDAGADPPKYSQPQADSIARSYPREQTESSAPAQMASAAWNPASMHTYTAQAGTAPNLGPPPAQHVDAQRRVQGDTSGNPSLHTNGTQDINAMENDLRRILKLNVSN